METSKNLSGVKSQAGQELILECARTDLSAAHIQRVKVILEQPVDWDSIIKISFRNGLLPLVSTNLLQTFGDFLPADVKKNLAVQLQEHTQNNLFQTAKLLEIIRTLADSGIPSLPFKGPALALQAYGNLALRKFVDLDVLVQPQHFDEAIQRLSKKDFKPESPQSRLNRKTSFFSHRKDVTLVQDDSKVRLELHWRLSGSHFALPFEINQLWERFEEINIGGEQVKALPFPDLLVYLSLHGSRHGWERLAWIGDLFQLIRSEQNKEKKIDWPSVAAHARVHGCEKVVELGLFLVEQFFGLTTGYPEWEKIQNNENYHRIYNQIRKKLFYEKHVSTEIGEWYMYHLALKERKTDKLKLHFHYFLWYLQFAVTPHRMDKAVFQLPKIFYPLYYILRPLRLLYTHFPLKRRKEKDVYIKNI